LARSGDRHLDVDVFERLGKELVPNMELTAWLPRS
jgi:hypothetical protein